MMTVFPFVLSVVRAPVMVSVWVHDMNFLCYRRVSSFLVSCLVLLHSVSHPRVSLGLFKLPLCSSVHHVAYFQLYPHACVSWTLFVGSVSFSDFLVPVSDYSWF